MNANLQQLKVLKLKIGMGDLTYSEAEKLAKPIIDNINNKAIELAKKYNRKPKLINFKSIR